MLRRVSRLTAVIWFCSICTTNAWAEEARWGLRWRAPDECLGPAELAQSVEEILARPTFGKDAQFRVEGTLLQGTSPRWKARLTLVSAAGDVLGTRELTSEEPDCHSLDKKLAMAVALTIEPNLKAPVVSPPPAPAAANDRAKGSAFVHIDSPSREVRLLRFGGVSSAVTYGTNGPTTVAVPNLIDECRAPCDEVIARTDDRFHVGGTGVTVSDELILADHVKDGRVEFKVRPGSAGGSVAGLVIAVWGVIGLVSGVPLALLGTDQSGMRPAGVGIILGGLALSALGFPLWLLNRTEVTFPDGTVVH